MKTRVLKAYHFVKEFGEGFDRICREQEANGANVPSFRTDEFILKITVPKVSEKVAEKVIVNGEKEAENALDTPQKIEQKFIMTENRTENRTETEQKPNRKRFQVDRNTYCDIAINERRPLYIKSRNS